MLKFFVVSQPLIAIKIKKTAPTLRSRRTRLCRAAYLERYVQRITASDN
jgi:hypothetical protein